MAIVSVFGMVACGTVNHRVDFIVDGKVFDSIKTSGSEEVELPANPVKDGYIFQGWYWDNDVWELPFTAQSLTFQKLSKSIAIFARFTKEELRTVTFDSMSGSAVAPQSVARDGLVTKPTKVRYSGFILVGWYIEKSFTTKWQFESDKITEDITLYAKWEELTDSIYKRIDANGVPNAAGEYILFGEYPQTIKADSITVGETEDDRGYYLGSDGMYYAKVIATPYYDRTYKFSNDKMVYKGDTYYFRVEPIKWRILSQSGGKSLILCESIIANMAYDLDFGNSNYGNSGIRAWLNKEFYNSAFGELQKVLIETTTVDNSVYSTGYDSNPFYCADTEDNIFLLSYRDMLNGEYGLNNDAARKRSTSDYSRSTGVQIVEDRTNNYGNGMYWLRSPTNKDSMFARCVVDDGSLTINVGVVFKMIGLVPALTISLI